MANGPLYEQHFYGDKFPFIFHTDVIFRDVSTFLHWHEAVEVLTFVEGLGMVTINSVQISAKPGDTIIINSSCLHSVHAISEICTYHCAIFENLLWERLGNDFHNTYFMSLINNEYLYNLFECINKEQYGDKPYLMVSVLSYMMLAAIFLCRNAIDKNYTGGTPGSTKKLQTVKKAINYINNNLTSEITVENIANKLSFTKYYLCHAFREMTGITIVTYLNTKRCDLAEQMLLEGNMHINEIATLCGFDNFSYFTRTYKRYKGVLPSQTKQISDGSKSVKERHKK